VGGGVVWGVRRLGGDRWFGIMGVCSCVVSVVVWCGNWAEVGGWGVSVGRFGVGEGQRFGVRLFSTL
jgi:hypothetical protein